MSDKVYAVYSIPRSPEYRLEKMFKTKEGAKRYIRSQIFPDEFLSHDTDKNGITRTFPYQCPDRKNCIFDIQIEEICE